MIEQESLRLLRVADQMSLGLKTDAGTLEFTFVVRDLEGPVLQGLHDAEVGDREVRVDADSDLRASIDGRWLAEAARQGIENALKFSPADTPIDLSVRRDGDDAVIEVADRGPGIPPEMHEQVFEKFCRWRPYGYEDRSGVGPRPVHHAVDRAGTQGRPPSWSTVRMGVPSCRSGCRSEGRRDGERSDGVPADL